MILRSLHSPTLYIRCWTNNLTVNLLFCRHRPLSSAARSLSLNHTLTEHTHTHTHTQPTLLWLCLMSPFSIGSANWKPQLRWYKIWDTSRVESSRVESSRSLQWINSSRKPTQAAVWGQSSLVLLHLSVFGRKLFHSVVLPAWIFSFVDSQSFSLLFTSWIHLSYNSFSPLVHLSHHWITESTSSASVWILWFVISCYFCTVCIAERCAGPFWYSYRISLHLPLFSTVLIC